MKIKYFKLQILIISNKLKKYKLDFKHFIIINKIIKFKKIKNKKFLKILNKTK
jgi:hypothetical protein